MSFEVYNSKEMVEKQLANHHSGPLLVNRIYDNLVKANKEAAKFIDQNRTFP